jgi:hypothetical protein
LVEKDTIGDPLDKQITHQWQEQDQHFFQGKKIFVPIEMLKNI